MRVPGNPVGGICANGTFTYTPNAGATATAGRSLTPSILRQRCGTRVHLRQPVHNGDPGRVDAYRNPSREQHHLHVQDGHVPEDSIARRALGGLGSEQPSAAGGRLQCYAPASGRNDQYGPEWRVHGNCHQSAGTYTFTYTVQNSQGRQSAPRTVTLIFPTPSNLQGQGAGCPGV